MEKQMHQIEMVTLGDLVPTDHVYRKISVHFPHDIIASHLADLELIKGADGYGIERLFKCLFLQFLEDLSDRQLARFLQENTSAKWFCDFGLATKTPSFTLFGKVRKKIGTSRLSKLFSAVRDSLQSQGYISEVFTFVDASHLISKATLWKERDAAIKKKYDKLNNETLPKVAHDQDARIGCKGNSKFWYGYKKHASVDMRYGLINKIALTPANTTDGAGLKNVCPRGGVIYADKGYCGKKISRLASQKGATLHAIKRNNMKSKNKDLDRFISGIRAPFEGVFSQDNKRSRYCGLVKNQFSLFMQAMAFNLKRLVVIETQRLAA